MERHYSRAANLFFKKRKKEKKSSAKLEPSSTDVPKDFEVHFNADSKFGQLSELKWA